MPQAVQLVQVLEELPVLGVVLGEAQSRVHDDLLFADPGCVKFVADAGQFCHHFAGHVLVLGQGVHGAGVAAAVREDIRRSGRRHQLSHLRLDGQPGNVVDDGGAGFQGSSGRGGVGGVDADQGARLDQGFDDGDHPALLFLRAHVLGIGARRFTADVDDVRPGVEHPQAGRDGAVRRGVLSAVAEGVRGDVQDAHDQGAAGGQVREFCGRARFAQDGQRRCCGPGSRGCS